MGKKADDEHAVPSSVPAEIPAREYLAQFKISRVKQTVGKEGQAGKLDDAHVDQTTKHAQKKRKISTKHPEPRQKKSKTRTVAQAFEYINQQAQIARMRAPIFGPTHEKKDSRPRSGRSQFCFAYFTEGSCPDGTNC